jgi:hypothetical protein
VGALVAAGTLVPAQARAGAQNDQDIVKTLADFLSSQASAEFKEQYGYTRVAEPITLSDSNPPQDWTTGEPVTGAAPIDIEEAALTYLALPPNVPAVLADICKDGQGGVQGSAGDDVIPVCPTGMIDPTSYVDGAVQLCTHFAATPPIDGNDEMYGYAFPRSILNNAGAQMPGGPLNGVGDVLRWVPPGPLERYTGSPGGFSTATDNTDAIAFVVPDQNAVVFWLPWAESGGTNGAQAHGFIDNSAVSDIAPGAPGEQQIFQGVDLATLPRAEVTAEPVADEPAGDPDEPVSDDDGATADDGATDDGSSSDEAATNEGDDSAIGLWLLLIGILLLLAGGFGWWFFRGRAAAAEGVDMHRIDPPDGPPPA